MQHLIEGYKRFRTQGWPERRQAFEKLASQGQKPKAMIIGCVDSRVDPPIIFDTGPGEILTVRNVANLVPPYAPDHHYHGTSAALEFGIRVLEIPHIVVLGHGLCGGVRTLLEGAPEKARDFVAPWMSIAESARAKAMLHPEEGRDKCCEQEVVKVSLANLMTFPWIADAVREGRLQLHGMWFSVYSGELSVLEADGNFKAVG